MLADYVDISIRSHSSPAELIVDKALIGAFSGLK